MTRQNYYSQMSVDELVCAAAKAKKGRKYEPVQPADRRKICTSWWGQAWCRSMEMYSDYQNRLPRGKRYVRAGAVVDLRKSDGQGPGNADKTLPGGNRDRTGFRKNKAGDPETLRIRDPFPGMPGKWRFSKRASGSFSDEERTISFAAADPFSLFLSGLGVHGQAYGGRFIRHRGQTR